MGSRARGFSVVAAGVVFAGTIWAGGAIAAVSDLDLSFDGDGVARTNLLGAAVATDVAVQADGTIVAAGTSDTAGSDNAVVARYLSTGALDTAGFGGGDGHFQAGYDGADTELTGVAVRSTGQIITAGNDPDGSDFGVVAQHTSAGPLDTAGFGSGDGLIKPAFNILSDPGSGNRFNDVALAANGDAIAVGSAEQLSSSTENFAAFSVTSAGVPRNPFGGGTIGEAQIDVGSNIGSTGESSANAVAIEAAGGDIIVAGTVDPTAADGGANDDTDVAVVRLTSAGVLDTGSGFGGGDGIVTLDFGDLNTASGVALQPDGKILLTGTRDTDAAGLDLDHYVMRLNANGGADTGFGDGSDGRFEQAVLGQDNFGDAIVRLTDGRVVVAGNTLAASNWVVARYTPAGLPDTSFDADGVRDYDFNPDIAGLNAIAAQSDGKLIVAGDIADDLAVGRLEADPVPPVVNPPVTDQPPAKKKKCKKGRKLKKGKCVKKKKRKKR
jgi:uncharacterized delta-60 repeat protein